MASDSLSDCFYPFKNGKPAFSPKLAPVVAHRFDYPAHRAGFFAKDVAPDHAAKEYLGVADMAMALEMNIVQQKTDLHLYELLAVDRPVRPYLDVEWMADEVAADQGWEYKEERVLADAIHVMTLALLDAGFQPSDRVSVFCASGMSKGRRKVSYHVLFDTLEVFPSVADHKRFMEIFVAPLLRREDMGRLLHYHVAGSRKCVIDMAPYMTHQVFRLPYQSKWTAGVSRPLVPVDLRSLARFLRPLEEAGIYHIGRYEDPAELVLISTAGWPGLPSRGGLLERGIPLELREEKSTEFPLITALVGVLSVEFLTAYEKARNLVWLLWGLEQTPRMRELIHTACSRAPNYSQKWVDDLIRMMRYTGFTIGSLRHWAEECTTADQVATLVKEYAARISYAKELCYWRFRPSRIQEVCVRYLSEALDEDGGDCRTLVIQSHLGTGKTVFIREMLQAGDDRRVLLLSPRRSYTQSQIGALSDLGVVSYMDHPVGTLGGFDRLIVQVESLHRIRGPYVREVEPYDVVIMDESESVLAQLHSVATQGANMIRNHEVLEWALRTAGRVVYADAFLSDRTLGVVNALQTEAEKAQERCLLVHNTYQPYARRAIRLVGAETDKRTANLGGFCERIMEALRAGRRIVVIWTSKRRGDWFVQTYLANSEFSYLFYSSRSSKEEQAGLQDVHTTWSQVQCLMMTTTITVGISYDPQDEALQFDEAFLYGSSASALPRDIAQALLRVRALKAERLTYVVDTRAGYYGIRGFTGVWGAMLKKEDRLLQAHPLIQWQAIPEWARMNYACNENEARISRAEYRVVLEMYLRLSGYELVEETHICSDAVMAGALGLEEAEVLDWDEIDSINAEQAETIHHTLKRGEATTEMLWMYKKHIFQRALRRGAEGDEWEETQRKLWERFYVRGVEGCFWNVYREKRMTLEEMVAREAEKQFAVMIGAGVEVRRTLERFLAMIGMRHSQEAVVLGPERLEELGPVLAGAEKGVREGMGLRRSHRKAGAWLATHSIDLIRSVLGAWGDATVEAVPKKFRSDGKIIRTYTVYINRECTFWDLLRGREDEEEFLMDLGGP
jgi:hypothetical protein